MKLIKKIGLLIPLMAVCFMIMGTETSFAGEFLNSTHDITVVKEKSYTIIDGVTEGEVTLQKSGSSGTITAHVIRVKPNAKAKFKVGMPNYYATNSQTFTAAQRASRASNWTNSNFATRSVTAIVNQFKKTSDAGSTDVIAAINGDFFPNGTPRGSVILEGNTEITSSITVSDEYFFAVDKQGAVGIVQRTTPQKSEFQEAICGGAHILRNGVLFGVDNERDSRQRSGVAIKPNGEVLMIAVRSGISVKQLAELMQAAGCWNGINFDGGGSSILLSKRAGGELTLKTQVASSGYSQENNQRLVANALMLVADSSAVANNVPATDQRTIKTSQDTYTVGEPVYVTASTHIPGAYVNIVQANETAAATPYFSWWNYGILNSDQWTYFNGKTYNVFKDGFCYYRDGFSSELPPGSYKAILAYTDANGNPVEIASKTFNIVADANGFVLSTDKSTYSVGDPIYVTALTNGNTPKAWVGITGKCTGSCKPSDAHKPFYWYYVSDNTHTNGGKYNIIGQSRLANDSLNALATCGCKNLLRADGTLGAGTYEVHVFSDDAYNSVKSKTITIIDPNASYDITYMDGSNKLTNLSPSSYTYAAAQVQDIALPTTVAKTGYTLEGWYTNANFTGAPVTSIAKGSTGAKTFYGKFTKQRYDVYFDLGDGTLYDEQSVEYGATASKPSDPTKAGYTFVNWVTSAGGTTPFNFDTAITGKTTVYAQFAKATFKVTYMKGSEEYTSQMIQAGNKAIRPTDPTPPSGQVFKYWYKDNSATAFDFNTAITENTTLHAKFGTASYKVSFNTAGGGTIADQYVDYNGLATEPSKPSKTGYDFVSWHTDASCLSEPFDFGTDRITGNVTLYAKFVKQKFTVTIDVDGVKTTQEVEYGGRVTRPSTPSKEGYDFVGWMTTENGTVAFNFNQEITAHTNIYAKFSVESFVVTFNTNGGTPVSPQSVELGKKVNQPSEKEKPEKTGYTFDGWYTDNTFTKEYDFSTPVTKPIVIYAKYSKSMYTVVFYDGNGDVFIESTIAYGEKISEPAEGPVKKHYTFAGWVTASGGTSAFNFNNPITKDTKIYPKYDKEIYKVTFVTVDGENEVIHTTQSVKYGEFAAIPSTNPTKTGYQFIGWGSSATGNTAFTFGTPIEKDTKVYAMYEAERYTVTFDLDGGESDEIDQERRVNYGEYVTRPTASPVKKGHTFANTWVTRIDGEEKTFDFGETKIEGNVVLYAKYNRNPYKVSFESNGGTAVVPQDLLYGDLAEEPVPPTKDAWDFVGWYDNAELQGERYDFSQIVEDNLILYAKWEEKDPYSVHFDIGYDADENNRVVGTAEVVEGTVIADEDIPEDPIRKGYEFDTWVDADGETFDFDKPIRKETTVYASWTPVEYSITYNPNEGTLLIEEPSSYTVIDETFILPVPVRDGYSFKGWRAADKTLYTKIETGKVTGNLELTAKWEEIKAISMNAPEYDFGDAIIVTANNPKAGAKVGLYKVGEVPGDEYEPIIEYDVIDENPVNLFSEAKAWRNPDREEEWYTSSQDVKSLKSGTYQVFLTVGETGEYEQRIVFTILKKQDKMEIVSRTCTTSGYTAISYTDGKVVVTQTEDDKALGHKWIAATCTTVKMCDTCKATEGSELGHTMILKEGIAPTCEEDGTKEHWHCLRCDGRFEDENGEHLMESIVEPLLAHKNTIEKVAYKEPTCGKTMVDGNIEYYRCTECDKKFEDKDGVTILKDDVIIKAKHNPKPLENCWEGQACSDCKELIVSPRAHVPGPEATCTTEQTCIRCDTKLAEKLPHTLSEAATCTKAQICLVCKEVKAEATGHSIKIRKSCTEPYQCEKCEVVFKEGAPEHIKGAPATCSEPQRCLVCNVITDEVEHTFVDANCQSPKHCTVCGLTEGDFGGHTPGLEATCEKDQICSDCGIVLKKAEGHQWSKREYCTDVVACTKCGIPSQTDLAEPDHDLDRNKEHATCTTPVKCKNCPYIYFGGHTPGPLQTCTKDMVCLECDEVLAPANGHSPSAEATCTKDQICTETGCGVILEKRLGHEPGPKATCTSVQKCTREGCGIILNGMKDHKPGVEATCKNPQACTECGVELKEKTGHTPGPEATCTTAKTCSVKGCDYVYEEALGHDMTEVACEVDQHCKRLNCEHTIKAPGHALVTIPEKEATCSEAGWDSYQNCSNCDYTTYTTDTLQPKKNHKTIVIPGTPATCTESGLKDGRMCGLCGAVTREQAEIEPLNHKKTITLEGYEATCTTDGLTEGEKCAYCSLVFKKQEVIPAGHTEAELTGYEPMCEKPGLTDGMMCGVCGKITKAQEVIPATGHTPVTLEGKAATCTANGLSEGQTCGDCGIILKEQETIPATGHKEVTVKGYAATCTTTGLTDGKKCETCGKTTVGQRPISCEGHNWSEGSCLEDSVCSKCSAVEKAPGHMPITIPSEEATCQEEGLTEGLMCGVCDMVLKEQSVLPILPHQVFEAELTPATTKADGVRVKLCECGEVLHTETIYKIKTVKLSFKSAVYNGKVKEPEVVITNSKGKRLTQNDYTVVMAAGRKDVGVYDYKITFKGDYEGTETLKLTVTPAKPKLRAHKPAKNAITVQWKKVEKQATGYQVMVATDKKFEKNVKKTFINKLKTTSYKMTGLKAKTNYYVKVRTYKTVKVDGKDTKIYSPWSAVKTVKTK